MSVNYPREPGSRQGMPVWGWLLIGCGCVGVGGLAFVAVLGGAIVFPVLQQSREKARQAACLSNLKQMGTALIMYVQDYDDRLPPNSPWMDLLLPYTKTELVYHCPSVWRSNSATFGYAFNSKLLGKPLKALSNPATVRAIYDSTNLSRNATDPLASLPSPGRHSGGNNFDFADGHAKWIRGMPAGNVPGAR